MGKKVAVIGMEPTSGYLFDLFVLSRTISLLEIQILWGKMGAKILPNVPQQSKEGAMDFEGNAVVSGSSGVEWYIK